MSFWMLVITMKVSVVSMSQFASANDWLMEATHGNDL